MKRVRFKDENPKKRKPEKGLMDSGLVGGQNNKKFKAPSTASSSSSSPSKEVSDRGFECRDIIIGSFVFSRCNNLSLLQNTNKPEVDLEKKINAFQATYSPFKKYISPSSCSLTRHGFNEYSVYAYEQARDHWHREVTLAHKYLINYVSTTSLLNKNVIDKLIVNYLREIHIYMKFICATNNFYLNFVENTSALYISVMMLANINKMLIKKSFEHTGLQNLIVELINGLLSVVPQNHRISLPSLEYLQQQTSDKTTEIKSHEGEKTTCATEKGELRLIKESLQQQISYLENFCQSSQNLNSQPDKSRSIKNLQDQVSTLKAHVIHSLQQQLPILQSAMHQLNNASPSTSNKVAPQKAQSNSNQRAEKPLTSVDNTLGVRVLGGTSKSQVDAQRTDDDQQKSEVRQHLFTQ